jgi:hypothetical protein
VVGMTHFIVLKNGFFLDVNRTYDGSPAIKSILHETSIFKIKNVVFEND